jgi:xanthine dehydrogenase accessory factor
MSIFQSISEIEKKGGAAALCTIIRAEGSTPRHVGSKMIVFPDGRIEGTIGGGEMESRVLNVALEAIADGKPRIERYDLADPGRGDPGVCGGQLEVFVEPIRPNPTLVVVGAGHVGKSVAQLAKWLGFRVVVSDDREGFATPDNIPDADTYIPGLMEILPEKMSINSQTFFVLCTRNVEVDIRGLPAILGTPAAYIGVIGSRRRWETTRGKLAAKGIEKEQLDAVVSPMGLEINAETPEEIAVSIMAEIIMLQHGGDGSRMGNRT